MGILFSWHSNYRTFQKPVTILGLKYLTGENLYQAQKTLNPELKATLASLTPHLASEYAKRIPIRPDWEDIKLAVMFKVQMVKCRYPNFLMELLESKKTDSVILSLSLSGNNYWNIPASEVVEGVAVPISQGENMLGKLLTYIRDNYDRCCFLSAGAWWDDTPKLASLNKNLSKELSYYPSNYTIKGD